MRPRLFCCIGGIVLGFFVGSSMGIAGFGGAIVGWWVFAPLGGYFGYRVGAWIERRRDQG